MSHIEQECRESLIQEKILIQQNLKENFEYSFVEFSFRVSVLSGLHPFDNISIICWVKNRSKIEGQTVSSRDTNPWSNFCDPHWELICCNKWQPGTSEISTPPDIAVETHFHAQHCTKTTPVFLPADGKDSWSLLPNSVSLLSDDTIQPENNYFCVRPDYFWSNGIDAKVVPLCRSVSSILVLSKVFSVENNC